MTQNGAAPGPVEHGFPHPATVRTSLTALFRRLPAEGISAYGTSLARADAPFGPGSVLRVESCRPVCGQRLRVESCRPACGQRLRVELCCPACGTRLRVPASRRLRVPASRRLWARCGPCRTVPDRAPWPTGCRPAGVGSPLGHEKFLTGQ